MLNLNSSISAMSSALTAMSAVRTERRMIEYQTATGEVAGFGANAPALIQVSERLKTQVSGLEVVRQEMSRGASTIDVAIAAGEFVSDIMTDMKNILVAASDVSLDTSGREALNEDFTRLRDEMALIVESAAFNKVNLIDGSLAHIDVRVALHGTGSITAATPKDAYQVLEDQFNALFNASPAFDQIGTGGDVAARLQTYMDDLKALDPLDKDFDKDSKDLTRDLSKDLEDMAKDAAGDDKDFKKVIKDEFKSLEPAMKDLVAAGDFSAPAPAPAPDPGTSGPGDSHVRVVGYDLSLGSAGNLINTSDAFATADEASSLLSKLNASQSAVDLALATLGSSRRALEIQEVVSQRWSDTAAAMRSSLVDADLDEASARNAALAVREQLLAKSISMANKTPQVLLGLFEPRSA